MKPMRANNARKIADEYGFSETIYREFLKHENGIVRRAVDYKVINKKMTVGQIREILLGLRNHKVIAVRVYADAKYSTNVMRVSRLLLDRNLKVRDIEKILIENPKYDYRQFLVRVLTSLADPGADDVNKRFVAKCMDEVIDLFCCYHTQIKNPGMEMKDILKAFDTDLYLAKISWLNNHPGECI